MLSQALKVAFAGVALSVMAIGCTAERHQEIPPQAMLSTEGEGQLAYRAPKDGRIYVDDVNSGRLVYTGQIKAGQLFMVEPSERHVTLDGDIVQDKALSAGHRHRVYFEPLSAEEKAMEAMRQDEMEGESRTASEVQPAGSGAVIVEDVQGTRTTELRPAEQQPPTPQDRD